MRNVCVGRGIGLMAQNGRAMGRFSSFFTDVVIDMPLINSLLPIKGPPITHVRASPATIFDYEDKLVTLLNNEIGFTGARRERNEQRYSQELTQHTGINATVVSTTDVVHPDNLPVFKVQDDTSSSEHALKLNITQFVIPANSKAIVYFDVKAGTTDKIGVTYPTSGDASVAFDLTNITKLGAEAGSIIDWYVKNLGDGWVRCYMYYDRPTTGTVSHNIHVLENTSLGITDRNYTGDGTLNFYVTRIMLADTTSNFDPSIPPEYISSDVLSAPYHGAGIDAVKCFATSNGNTVKDNVVTEAVGPLLHPGRIILNRSNSKAYVIGDEVVVGDFWYEALTAGTSAASEGTFDTDIGAGQLMSNGDAEIGGIDNVSLPDNWSIFSTPDLAVKSSDAKSNGGYGFKIVGEVNQGVQQDDTFSVVSGKKYLVTYSAYMAETEGTGNIGVRLALLDGNGTNLDINMSVVTPLQTWTHFSRVVTSAQTGSLARISFARINNIAAGDKTTVYIDNISIKEISDDNGIAWLNKGYYKEIKGLHREEERINRFTKSREFDHTDWIKIGTPVLTQDQIGIDGKPNTAFSFEDNSGTSHEAIRQLEAVVDDTKPTTKVIYVKKDTDETRFPEFQLYYGGGTTNPRANLQFNTNTGDYTLRSEIGTVIVKIKLIGNFWEIIITVYNDGSGNINVFLDCYASVGDVWGSADVAATGTIVIDFANLFEGYAFATNPIFTDAAEVTHNATQLSFSSAGVINDVEGAIRIKWTPMYDHAEHDGTQIIMLAVDNTGAFLFVESNGDLKSFDSGGSSLTLLTDYYAGIEYDILIIWYGALKEAWVNGISVGAAVAYTGSWNNAGTFKIGSDTLNNRHDSAEVTALKIWKKKVEDAEAISITQFLPNEFQQLKAWYKNDINTITYDSEGVSQWDDSSGNDNHLIQATDNAKPMPGTLGADVVINGGFDTDTNWTKETGWSIGAGVASCDGSQIGNTALVPNLANTVEGTLYAVTYTVLNYISGAITPIFGATAGIVRSANGTYTELIVQGAGLLKTRLRGNSSFVGDVDNFIVKPLAVDGSITFDGIQQYLKTVSFDLKQPTTIYFLGKQITWTSLAALLDGDTINSGKLRQVIATPPNLEIYAGAQLGPNNDLALDTYGTVVSVFNGTSSLLQVNNNTPVEGDAGTGDMDGLILGAAGDIARFSNMNAKELLVFNEYHTPGQRAKIIAYLNNL